MYAVAIGSEKLDLDRLTDEQASIRLERARDAGEPIHCHCHEARGLAPPRPALVLRTVRRGSEYHLRRDPPDAQRHHAQCRHRTLTEAGLAELGYSPDVLRLDDGEVRISLDFGLTAAGNSRDDLPATGAFQLGKRALRTRSRASLLGLLHLLWTEAELQVHDPARPPQDACERLGRAARRVQPARMTSLSDHGLSSLLLLPKNALPGEDQLRRNFGKLRDGLVKRRRILAAGTVDQALLAARNSGGYATLHSVFGVLSSVHGSTIERALESSPAARSALGAGHPVVLFGVGPVSELRDQRRPSFTLERIVLMAVTPHLIPVESSHELELALRLEAAGRRFAKPLRFDAEEPVHPDFVLLDTAPAPVPIEVYGMSSPEYLRRKAVKQAYYESAFPRHFEWDATSEPIGTAVARLPSPAP